MSDMIIDWELSPHELAEMNWWEANPDATEEQFHIALALDPYFNCL